MRVLAGLLEGAGSLEVPASDNFVIRFRPEGLGGVMPSKVPPVFNGR